MPGDQHLMLIRVHLDHITFLNRAGHGRGADRGRPGRDPRRPGASAPTAGPGRAPGAARTPAVLPAAERLAEIPGVSPGLAMAIIAETGLDMTRFPTAAHLASWAGLAPVARQSGPRNRKPGKGRATAPQGLLHPGRQRRRPHRDLPRRTAPPPVQAPGREPGQVRRRRLPSWSSSGTCSPAPKPGSPTSDPTGTHATATATARSRPTSASSGPSASTSPSPPPPPKPQTPLTRPVPQAATGR